MVRHTVARITAALIFPLYAFAAAAEPTHVDALWVGQTTGLLKLAADDGRTLFALPEAGDIRAAAVDERRGTLWAVGAGGLSLYGPTGPRLLRMDLPGHGEGWGDSAHLALAVDSDDGSLWLGQNRWLYRIDTAGNLVLRIALSAPVLALAPDPRRGQIWVAGATELSRYDRTGALSASLRFAGKGPIAALAFDPALDVLWAADNHRLYRHGADGALGTIGLPGARHLASDRRGGLWIATRKEVIGLDASGLTRFSLEPFQGADGVLVALTAAPSDGAAWVAGAHGLARIGVEGTLSLMGPGGQEGGRIRALALYADTLAPRIAFSAPAPGTFLNDKTPALWLTYSDEGTGIDPDSLRVQANGGPLEGSCTARADSAHCLPAVALPEGDLSLTATIADRSANRSAPAELTLTIDTIAPVIEVLAPQNGGYTNRAEQILSGRLDEPAELRLDARPIPLGLHNDFAEPLVLTEGLNALHLVATDRAGNVGTLEFSLTLDTVAPAAPVVGLIALAQEGGEVLLTGEAGSVEGGALVRITNTRTGEVRTVRADSQGGFAARIAAEAGDRLSIGVLDEAGNAGPARELTWQAPAPRPDSGYVPPDPATAAPALDPAVPTGLFAATEFLYSGPKAVQFDVAPGAIDPPRVAVVRGRVLQADGAPLAGVSVTVANHPEWGWSGTRADGMLDLVVNGGGTLLIEYRKSGYLPAQRRIDPVWDEFVWLPDVVLLPLDPQVTAVSLTGAAPLQVARGSRSADASGERQATLMFPAGTGARMVMADGSTQPLATLHVRATEYSVGPLGEAAMPAELPPTSAYTYAVEYTVDEALAAGARQVRFDRPVYAYVENFLRFPVGLPVPSGWYDPPQGAWVASDDGRIVKILAIEGGLAQLDISGQGAAAPEELAALGFSEAERRELARLYGPGQTLWRVPIEHFSSYDFNWGAAPTGTEQTPPRVNVELDLSDPDLNCGSIIECQNQALGEAIPLAGAPYTLNYRSRRVPGYLADGQIKMKLNGDWVHDELLGMVVKIVVAGQLHTFEFPPEPNQELTFTWDGRDAYGRLLYGMHPARVSIGFTFPARYLGPRPEGSGEGGATNRSFAMAEEAPITIEGGEQAGTRRKMTLWDRRTVLLQGLGPDQRVSGVGGWSLDVHHTYDPHTRTLQRGDGSLQEAVIGERVYEKVHYEKILTPSGTTIPASSYTKPALDIALDAEGALYFSTGEDLLRVDAHGSARFLDTPYWAFDLEMGPDNALYVSNREFIYRLGAGGEASIIAGGGQSRADGAPATEAKLDIRDFGFGPEGSLYIADALCIRRVGADGRIRTIAGDCGPWDYTYRGTLEGQPATRERNLSATALAVDEDGAVYFSDAGRSSIRRIGPDGILSTLLLHVPTFRGMAFDRDGSLLIAESVGAHQVRRVGRDGSILPALGPFELGPDPGDRGPATLARLRSPYDVEVAPDGSYFVTDVGNKRILRVGALPPQHIVSADGREIYVFDGGRHTQTLDALTGALRRAFTYTEQGLAAIEEASGARTRIERGADGAVSALISPEGIRTAFTYDANGYLASVVQPHGAAHRLAHRPDGLLASYAAPNGAASRFAYDAVGRLVSDTNAANGGWRLERQEREDGYAVRMISAEGRITEHVVQRTAQGESLRTTHGPDGTRAMTTTRASGNTVHTAADGTAVHTSYSPDPRFAMQAPLENLTVVTPEGLRLESTTEREVSLADANDPLSLIRLSETRSVNGRRSSAEYTAAERTWRFTSAQGRGWVETYDGAGRLLSSAAAGIEPDTFAYDGRGRLSALAKGEDAERVYTFAYSPDGWLERITDPLNRTVRFTHDAVGRITTQTLPDGRAIEYRYDPNGNLSALIPPGREAHLFEYTPLDQQARYAPPALAGIDTLTRYRYTLDGQLTRIERPDGVLIDLEYDSGGRLSGIVLPRGRYAYDYHPTSGRLGAITAPDGSTLHYTWDGFLALSETAAGAVSGTVSRAYDNNFWLRSLAVNDKAVSFDYDDDGLLTRAGDLSLSRDAHNGLLEGTRLGTVQTRRTYDRFGELASETVSVGDAQVLATVYTRDRLGRIAEKRETTAEASTTTAYRYDIAGRLTQVLREGVVLACYTYDANGNRLSRTTAGGSETGVYDAQDRMSAYAGTLYTYSANGEVHRPKRAGGRHRLHLRRPG